MAQDYTLHCAWEWHPNKATNSDSDIPSWSERSSSAKSSTSKQETIGDLAIFEIPEPRRMYFEGGASDRKSALVKSIAKEMGLWQSMYKARYPLKKT